jgi:hypothetical protein
VPAARNRLAAVTLTISGSNLGNGSDITLVTVCGAPATVLVQSGGSVTVAFTGTGAVTPCTVVTTSTSYGVGTASGAYQQLPGTRAAPPVGGIPADRRQTPPWCRWCRAPPAGLLRSR